MLCCTNAYPRQGIFGVSHFRQKGCHYSYRPTWIGSCQPAFLDSPDLTGIKRLHSQAINGQKGIGFKFTKMSHRVVEKVDSNTIIEENSQKLPLSSAYETAMEALSSLITSQKRGAGLSVGGKYKKLDRMLMYIKILGLEEHIAGLKIIHVAGTKGKGSTCTFCEAILRECGFRTGLFCSPHLIDVRERFRLDGLDITEDKFLLYFWDCWYQFKEKVTEELPMPPLFQFLTALAFKIFVCEKVDVAIIEVGLGGRKDSTNVIKDPIVCGITSLGMDHIELLGDTLGQIASHKAGIFKPQIPAFTAPQLSEAMEVLQERAQEQMVHLEIAAPLDCRKLNGIKLSLSGAHQYINAGLAVSLCKSWLQRTGNWKNLFENDVQEESLPEPFLRGLSTARLSGRAQIIHDSALCTFSSSSMTVNSLGDLIFYLDGAHSPESMEACARWFSSAVKVNKNLSLPPSPSFKIGSMEEGGVNGYIQHEEEKERNKLSKQVLLFNCMDVRDPQILLSRLVSTCASSGTHFSKAIFVPSISKYNKVTSGSSLIHVDIPARDLSWQFNLQKVWESIIHGKDILLDKNSTIYTSEKLAPHNFLHEDVSHSRSADGYFTSSLVIPSLPLAIKWLRDCVKEKPSLRIQVLVTGSMHLVGDVLKLLKK